MTLGVQRSSPGRFACSFLMAAFALAAESSAQTTFFVDASASAGGDGLSWSTSWNTLQPALSAAGSSDQVWVAAGTYTPTQLSVPGDPRSATFRFQSDLKIYGGFRGDESTLGERDPELFDHTILSGDLGVLGDAADNAYHVVEVVTGGFPSNGSPALLDGFRITAGNADGAGLNGYGGGVYVNIVGFGGVTPKIELRDCKLDGNHATHGGAVSVRNFGLARLLRCTVASNTSANRGGAVFSNVGFLTAVNCSFLENVADDRGGVIFAMAGASDSTTFTNCLFVGNQADRGGAAFIWADLSAGGGGGPSATSPGRGYFYNCTFSGNHADVGGAVYAITNTTPPAQPAVARIYNCIVWGNTATTSNADIFGTGLDVRYSDTQTLYAGAGNIATDPLFVDGTTPSVTSPVNDAGSNGLLPPDYLDVDGDGNTGEEMPMDLSNRARRTSDPTIVVPTGSGTPPIADMGAYELNYSRLDVVPFTLSAAPGTVRNYQAFGTLASASGPDVQVDVTGDVVWTSGNTAVATFSGWTLTLDAVQEGYAAIRAELPGNLRSRGPVIAVSTTTTEPIVLYAGWDETEVRTGVSSTVRAEARVVGPVTKVFFPPHGEMRDDGMGGDLVAGDRVWTWTGASSLFGSTVGDEYLEIIATKQQFLTPQIPLWDQGYLWPYLQVGSPATGNPPPGYWTFPTDSESDGYGARLGGVGFGLTALQPNTAGVLTLMATQVSDPLTWVRTFNLGSFVIALKDDGSGADQLAGDGLWTAEVTGLSIPESLYIVDFRANWESPANNLGDVYPRFRVHQDL